MRNLVLISLLACSLAISATLFHRGPKKESNNNITLSESNSIVLSLPITEETVRDVQMKLVELDNDSGEPIYLVLNSPGGSVDSGMHLVETIQGMRRPVDSISIFSASMSFMLSEYTRNRYAISWSTIMAHRASIGGIEGQIPGSFYSRINHIMAQITEIEEHVAARVGISLEEYRDSVENELWLTGTDAVSQHYMDKVITISCDSTLSDYGPPQTFKMFIFEFVARFHKCPLIMAAHAVENKGDAKFDDILQMMLSNRAEFARKYGSQGNFLKLLK